MKTILCYGDSITWGMAPMTSLSDATRLDHADRWSSVVQEALGKSATVIAEGLNGRTTVFDDPIDGQHKNGLTYLLPCLESHAPLDLVVIMLGTNDTQPRFSLSPYDIASGAGLLVQTVTANIRGQNGVAPAVLLICPPLIRPSALFADAFAGAPEKSEQLHKHYKNVADRLGCHYLNGEQYARASQIDGIHLDAQQQHALGRAVADYSRQLLAG